MTQTLAETIAAHGLTINAEFVPFSQSRNVGESHRSLNWRVTLQQNGRDILTTDYGAGIAYCPAYNMLKMNTWNNRETIEQREAIEFETEKGRAWRRSYLGIGGAHIMPDPIDVIYSLAMDSDVLSYCTFEQWAESFGYDSDSRKAESTYRACLEIALKLRNGIGENALAAHSWKLANCPIGFNRNAPAAMGWRVQCD